MTLLCTKGLIYVDSVQIELELKVLIEIFCSLFVLQITTETTSGSDC